ncbi:BfmA/BtgA family mobilization protein [Lutibacter flavus]|uniref:Uncharacterized protein n=1 Tax=Lutibacter flavus TaxID=691689 RepID=A0A238YCE7_9FLAO|nr:BfmA/BtgA family mobilization protein [Lutibacter flavus]SNR68264.1 hypothetical protein SAMN04488111_2438 [Lutibacter flavus]
MDKSFKKEQFQTLKIKTSVVKRFRRFSKKMSQSQSMTLLLMLDFFEHNGVSPNETLGPQIQTLENLIKKRINGVIAIVKDIEKNQTKPTVAMLQALFEQTSPDDKSLQVEKKVLLEKNQKKISN